jgi:1-phosphofructokinase family hexose kinase
LIVTVTINPAIDRIISVDRLAFEDRAYMRSSRESAGGRGLNSSCVVHSFGGRTTALLISGGESGKRLKELVKCAGHRILIVPVKNAVRTNLTITDQQGLTVNVNESGPELAKTEVAHFERAVRNTLDGLKDPQSSWLLVCGSTPPGVPHSFYRKLLAMARERNVKTLLHADGESLREGLEAKPTVVNPNQREAERLLGRALLTRTHYLEAAAQIRTMGPESVVLSLGSRGAVGAFPTGLFEILPPRVDAVCPIGAGDALTAVYTWSIERTRDPVDALRWGVAAGTASACLPGMSFANLAQTEEIYREVEVRRAE